MILSDFHLLRPLWLLALIPFAVLLTLLHRHRLSRGNWAAACDDRLLPYVLLDKPISRQRWPLALFGLGGTLAIAALAGPTWEQLPVPVFRNESALVIVLDLSRSMDASDIKPSRLQRARFKIVDILKRRKDGQSALIVYAGDAFTVTPLTDDNDTISSQLAALTPSIMPSHSSVGAATPAIKQAAELLKQAGLHNGNILLITDSVTEQAIETAQRVNSRGYTVSVLGVGTEQGAPIPLPGGFLKDDSGAIVIPRLQTTSLNKLAAEGGGLYHTLTTDDSDIEALQTITDPGAQPNNGKSTSLQMDQWYELGPWLLIALLPIAALGFRRGYLGAVLLCLLPLGENAQALEWKNLWATPDQQARTAYDQGQMEQAAETFDDPAWKAAAAYAAGHYDQAIRALDGLHDSESHYNKGNALARSGRYQEAIAAYDKALESQPALEDAQYNKELVEQLLKQQQRQKNQQQPSAEDAQSNREQSDQNADNTEPSQRQSADQSDRSQQDSPQQANSNESARQEEPSASESEPKSDHRAHNPGEPDTRMSERQEEGNMDDQESPQAAATETGQMLDQASENKGADEESRSRIGLNHSPDEQQQANEQWLRRIPDDPAGLLRRKFQYQYQQRQRQQRANANPW